MENKYAIEVLNLSKKFGSFTAVDNISFNVKYGEIFGFLGANGAGKTTAIKMLIGLSKPSGGEAKVAGFDVSRKANRIKQNIGYMSQRFSLYEDLSIRQNIRFYGGIYGLSRKEILRKSSEIIDQLNLKEFANSVVGSLPLGWKQKLSFAVAGIHKPRIIFLDEPTGGVDPSTRRQFWEMIYEAADKGQTIFVTTHYMDEAEYCDRVSIMVDGKIEALGSPLELKNQYKADKIEDVFIKLARN